ncbi:MAG: SDR family oxidoreductase, partial [Pseudolabrys sp.]
VSLIDATEKEKGVSREEAEAIWLDEVPLGRMGSSRDFGRLAAVLVSDVASYVTGTAVSVDGGKARGY